MTYKIPEQPNVKLDAGNWAEYQGARFLIAHAGNDRFQRRMQALNKPFRRKAERGEMDPVDQKRILTQALGEGVLLGWEGVQDAKGEAVPYSSKVAIQMLTNDPALRDFVMEYSMDLQNFREDDLEHEGNS